MVLGAEKVTREERREAGTELPFAFSRCLARESIGVEWKRQKATPSPLPASTASTLGCQQPGIASKRSADVFDLYEIIQSLISSGSIGAFEVEDRFYDIGTEARYSETEKAVGDAGPSEESDEGP